MEIEFSGKKIVLNKELSKIDEFVIEFTKILGQARIKYTLVSGYVSILFGRSRGTEDIDMFIEELSEDKFEELSKLIKTNGLWFLNSDSDTEIFDMLKNNLGIRVADYDKAVPNFELKFPKKELDFISLQNPITVVLNGNELFISPLEIQIAYKLYLGSEKDIEDCVHLYEIFKDKLDSKSLNSCIDNLGVRKKAIEYGIE